MLYCVASQVSSHGKKKQKNTFEFVTKKRSEAVDEKVTCDKDQQLFKNKEKWGWAVMDGPTSLN